MVDPISEAERDSFRWKVKAGIAALVGASGGLVTSQVEATLPETAGAVAVGLAVGYALAWFIVPSGPAPVDASDRRSGQPPVDGEDPTGARENPFADGSGGRAGENDERSGRRRDPNRDRDRASDRRDDSSRR
jgi:hypothetical protein